MDFKDYYKILGVERNAAADAIKTAYRKLARKYHPDLNPGDKKAEERFKGINEAYDVLGDPAKRRKYDELGSNWEQIIRDRESARQHAGPGFGGAAAGGEDTEHEFSLTLEELVAGGKRSVRLAGGELCGACGGSGRVSSTASAHGRRRTVLTVCPTCRGEGQVARSQTIEVT